MCTNSGDALQYPCGSCKAVVGQPCRTRSGAVTGPHRYRLDEGPVYRVACPACGAHVMELCRSRQGNPTVYHHARYKLAHGIA